MSELLRASARFFLLSCLACTFATAYANMLSDTAPTIQDKYGKLPLAFERNQGQFDSKVKFLARGQGYNVFLTAQEAVMVFSKEDPQKHFNKTTTASNPVNTAQSNQMEVIRMRFVGGSNAPAVDGIEPLDFKTNYFVGEGAIKRYKDIANHARVKYTSIYPGIDLVYYGKQQKFEYDLVLAPRAKPQQIKISFAGATKISQSEAGDLILHTPIGNVVHRKPIAYQDIDGLRKPVEVKYSLLKNGKYATFDVGKYDPSQPLIIDPIVSYSSFLWGAARGVATDSSGNAYVAGFASATNLPATNGYQTKLAGSTDAYVVKLDPTGTKVIYATYLGARRAITNAYQIAVDSSGNVYLAGTTNSASFPVTSGAFQTTSAFSGGLSSFLTKLNVTGNALIYSTFLNPQIASIAVDSGGNIYMTGSGVITTTPGAFQATSPSSAYVAKLNASGTAMVYATYLSGTGNDQLKGIAIDAGGNAYVTGITRSIDFPTVNAIQSTLLGSEDAFVAKLNTTGSALVYSTYLGGSDVDEGNAIAVTADGQAVVAGMTFSTNFPISQSAFQRTRGYLGYPISNGFVTKLSGTGALIYSSYIGGTWCSTCTTAFPIEDVATAVAVDAAGYAYVGGFAGSPAFPSVDPVSPPPKDYLDANWAALFFAKVNPLGNSLIYSVVVGERAQDKTVYGVAVDGSGNAIAVGYNYGSYDVYPATAGAVLATGNSVIVKLSNGQYPTTISSVSNPVSVNQSITLTAKVLSVKPGGTVTFMDGTNSLGAAPMADGTATITINLPAGVHKLTAVYSADGIASPPLYQIINSN